MLDTAQDAAAKKINARKAIDLWRKDPSNFCVSALNKKPWPTQSQIINAVFANRRVAVKSCNGIGKTTLGAMLTLSFSACYPGSLVLTTATGFSQVKNQMWREIRNTVRDARAPLGVEVLTTELRWPNGSFAVGLTAPNYDPTRLTGYRSHKTLIIVDEASGVSPQVMEAVQSMVTGEESHLLLIGNPTDPNSDFAKAFTSESYVKFTVDAFATPNFTKFGIAPKDIEDNTYQAKIKGRLPCPWLTTPSWVREVYEKWGPDDPRYQARVMAQFPVSGTDSLIPFWWVEKAQAREIDGRVQTSPVELGVDVARYGGDETIVMIRVGDIAKEHCSLKGNDLMSVCGTIKRAVLDTGAIAVKVDECGIGAGVVDRLKEMKRDGSFPAKVIGINVANSPKDKEKFMNLKAEAFWGLRERFEDGSIVLDGKSDKLAEDLSSVKWKLNSRGQIYMESKEDLRRRGIKSPDRADALMLAFCPSQSPEIVLL